MTNSLVFPYVAVMLCAYSLLVLCALADGVASAVAQVRQKGETSDAA